MREIKFRAWVNRPSGCMLGWETINQTTFNSEYDSVMIWEVFHNPNIEIMQFTGLHDNNGREIYVGDIVNSWAGLEGANESYFREVVIDDNQPEIRFEPSTGYTLCKSNEHLFEVVGNVFENPELWEGSE